MLSNKTVRFSLTKLLRQAIARINYLRSIQHNPSISFGNARVVEAVGAAPTNKQVV